MRIDRIKLTVELAKRNITQKKIAELAGVSRPTVNAIKNGKSCTNEVGEKIAKALNIPISELLED